VHTNSEAVDAINNHGAYMLFLPPYSPDVMPAERIFSHMKATLKGEHRQMLDQARAGAALPPPTSAPLGWWWSAADAPRRWALWRPSTGRCGR